MHVLATWKLMCYDAKNGILFIDPPCSYSGCSTLRDVTRTLWSMCWWCNIAQDHHTDCGLCLQGVQQKSMHRTNANFVKSASDPFFLNWVQFSNGQGIWCKLKLDRCELDGISHFHWYGMLDHIFLRTKAYILSSVLQLGRHGLFTKNWGLSQSLQYLSQALRNAAEDYYCT